ncbi:MAG: hypothetical protein K2F82_00305, partial [Muribaculaceae bacterium]|nr:hypothetical protein [Muribaculaceae bacterium]
GYDGNVSDLLHRLSCLISKFGHKVTQKSHNRQNNLTAVVGAVFGPIEWSQSRSRAGGLLPALIFMVQAACRLIVISG